MAENNEAPPMTPKEMAQRVAAYNWTPEQVAEFEKEFERIMGDPDLLRDVRAIKGPAGSPVLDWSAAEQHLNEIKEGYQDLVGRPGVNPMLALGNIHHLHTRFMMGERTERLYREIMALE